MKILIIGLYVGGKTHAHSTCVEGGREFSGAGSLLLPCCEAKPLIISAMLPTLGVVAQELPGNSPVFPCLPGVDGPQKLTAHQHFHTCSKGLNSGCQACPAGTVMLSHLPSPSGALFDRKGHKLCSQQRNNPSKLFLLHFLSIHWENIQLVHGGNTSDFPRKQVPKAKETSREPEHFS